jgi:two-component system response regulator ResD
VVKPFSNRELMMRIHAVLRRSGKEEQKGHLFQRKGLVMDLDAHTVTVDGKRVELSLKEYDLLAYLAQHEGQVMRREQILEAVWGMDFFGDERTLDTHVKLLRKDIAPYSNLIVTVRGVGYRFEKEEAAAQ